MIPVAAKVDSTIAVVSESLTTELVAEIAPLEVLELISEKAKSSAGAASKAGGTKKAGTKTAGAKTAAKASGGKAKTARKATRRIERRGSQPGCGGRRSLGGGRRG
jgi:hypothetical protein